MALNTGFDLGRAVVAGCRRHRWNVTRGSREVLIGGGRDRRPRSRTGMTRSTRCYGRDEVGRRFGRSNVSGIAPVVVAIVTALTCFERHHRMVHRRICKGPARILMAAIAIDFS